MSLLKKISSLICITSTIFLCSFGTANSQPAAAASSTDKLLQQILEVVKEISKNVQTVLVKVNDLPVYIANLTAKDEGETTANLQGNFTEFGNLLMKTMDDQISAKMFGPLNMDLLTGNATNPDPNLIPNFANDLVYSSLLGSPYHQKDPRNQPGKPPVNFQYNYIKNASAINISHAVPSDSWGGTERDKEVYKNWYSTITAVESFNGYVLSSQYLDGNQFNTLQRKLISQASDPKGWFAQIASQSIGVLFRQMLMYQSQIYILLTQLIQTQKQLVTAQAMTNSVLIANNAMNEQVLTSKALGLKIT